MAQIKKEEINKQIQDAALKLFASKGYKETSISDIAKGAGISVGNVYRYYGSKLEIMHDIVPDELIAYAKKKLFSKMQAGKQNTILEQIDSEIYLKNSQDFFKEVMVNRFRILAFVKCRDEKQYVDLKQEFINYIVQSFMDGFILDKQEQERKRTTITFLYRGFMASFIELLSWECEEKVIMEELTKLTRYHVYGLTSLV